AIVFFLEFVLFGVRRGIATTPEGFNKIVALDVVGKLVEGRKLFRCNDVRYLLIAPFLVRVLHLAGLLGLSWPGKRIILSCLAGISRQMMKPGSAGGQTDERCGEEKTGTDRCDHVSNLRGKRSGQGCPLARTKQNRNLARVLQS